MWTEGRLSCVEFNNVLEDFVERSRTLGDDWEVRLGPECLQLDPTQPVKYLVKQYFREVINKNADLCNATCIGNDELSIIEDDDCEISCDEFPKHYAKYEYHVVYSPSYSVPVLYFTACTQDGCPLSLDDVWSAIPSLYQQRVQQEKWTFLTQQEHPFLGKPFFQLHPCHTADMMKNISATTEQESKHATKRFNKLLIRKAYMSLLLTVCTTE